VSSDPALTLRSILDAAETRLRNGPHPERARQDAEALMRQLLGKNRAWLLTHGDERLSTDHAERYAALIERRAAGEPIQYIAGETEFYGIPFRVAPDVLIPRPETEQLVEKVVEFAPLFRKPRIVDVGAGSGAIAVALAHECPSAEITAIDISSSALQLARWNAGRAGFAERIRFLHGDLLAPVAGEQFDIVASNPPYVPEGDRPTLAVEVRDHEPHVALFAGADGLDVIRRLIPAAFAALAPGGALIFEFGFGQWPAIRELLRDSHFGQIDFVPDLQGIPRVACAVQPYVKR
jgi:release factor glutamine methyltransferase